MKSKYLLFCVAALAFAAVSAGDFVANPQRAYNVTWKKHFQNGRDFWLILTPNWHSLKGVSNEEFVKNSATSTWLFFEGSNTENRLLSLNNFTAFDDTAVDSIEYRLKVSAAARHQNCNFLHLCHRYASSD